MSCKTTDSGFPDARWFHRLSCIPWVQSQLPTVFKEALNDTNRRLRGVNPVDINNLDKLNACERNEILAYMEYHLPRRKPNSSDTELLWPDKQRILQQISAALQTIAGITAFVGNPGDMIFPACPDPCDICPPPAVQPTMSMPEQTKAICSPVPSSTAYYDPIDSRRRHFFYNPDFVKCAQLNKFPLPEKPCSPCQPDFSFTTKDLYDLLKETNPCLPPTPKDICKEALREVMSDFCVSDYNECREMMKRKGETSRLFDCMSDYSFADYNNCKAMERLRQQCPPKNRRRRGGYDCRRMSPQEYVYSDHSMSDYSCRDLLSPQCAVRGKRSYDCRTMMKDSSCSDRSTSDISCRSMQSNGDYSCQGQPQRQRSYNCQDMLKPFTCDVFASIKCKDPICDYSGRDNCTRKPSPCIEISDFCATVNPEKQADYCKIPKQREEPVDYCKIKKPRDEPQDYCTIKKHNKKESKRGGSPRGDPCSPPMNLPEDSDDCGLQNCPSRCQRPRTPPCTPTPPHTPPCTPPPRYRARC